MTANPSVYIETSVVSYLTARPSRDFLVLAHQRMTSDWWTNRLPQFSPDISHLVVDEASAGDPSAAELRLQALVAILRLRFTEEAKHLAALILEMKLVPRKAPADDLHIAIATSHGLDYLLTWNCKHIANAEKRTALVELIEPNQVACPVICTPEELMGA